MKYFMQLDEDVYTMEPHLARNAYEDLVDKGLIRSHTVDWAYDTGLPYVFRSGSRLWGEDITDGELFKRLLSGKVQHPEAMIKGAPKQASKLYFSKDAKCRVKCS